MINLSIDEGKKLEKKNVPTLSSGTHPLMVYQSNTGESATSFSIKYIERKRFSFNEALEKILDEDDELLERLAE